MEISNLNYAEAPFQGVSTRKVSYIMEALCGLEVPSTPVSRAAAELDSVSDRKLLETFI